MIRKRRRSKVAKAKKAVQRASKALVVPARSSVPDVVAHMRRHWFSEFPELPDKVLRATASKAMNTRRAVRANYKVWRSWCAAQRPPIRPYPGTAAAVAAFLQTHAPVIRVTRGGDFEVLKNGLTPNGDQAKTYSTLLRYLGTLSKLNIEGGHPDPTRDPEVVAVWRVLRRGLDRPAQKQGMGFEAIRQALIALPNTLAGKRDRAILLLAYCLMTRRSELVALNVKDFDVAEDGSAMVTFERLKTGVQATNYVSPEVMAVVREWLAAAHIKDGALFPRLDYAANGKRTRMTPQSVGNVFKRVARMLNLPELDPARISSHSARIGATQDLVQDGAPDAAIMRDAGWKTPRMVGMYSRETKASQGAMAARLNRLSTLLDPSDSHAVQATIEAVQIREDKIGVTRVGRMKRKPDPTPFTLHELEQIVTSCSGQAHALTYAAPLLTKIRLLESRGAYGPLLEPVRTARDQADLRGRLLELNLAYQFERAGFHPQFGAKQSGTGDIDFRMSLAGFEVFLETKLIRQAVATTTLINSQLAGSDTFGVARSDDTDDIARLQRDLIQKATPRKFDPKPQSTWINLVGVDVSELQLGMVDLGDCLLAAAGNDEAKARCGAVVQRPNVVGVFEQPSSMSPGQVIWARALDELVESAAHPREYIHGAVFLFRAPKDTAALVYDLKAIIVWNPGLVTRAIAYVLEPAIHEFIPRLTERA